MLQFLLFHVSNDVDVGLGDGDVGLCDGDVGLGDGDVGLGDDDVDLHLALVPLVPLRLWQFSF